jgi:hypothetical protein
MLSYDENGSVNVSDLPVKLGVSTEIGGLRMTNDLTGMSFVYGSYVKLSLSTDKRQFSERWRLWWLVVSLWWKSGRSEGVRFPWLRWNEVAFWNLRPGLTTCERELAEFDSTPFPCRGREKA